MDHPSALLSLSGPAQIASLSQPLVAQAAGDNTKTRPSVDVLLRAAGSPLNSVASRSLVALERWGRPARLKAAAALSADSRLERIGALRLLARVATGESVTALVACLNGKYGGEAPELLEALGRTTAPEAMDALLQTIESGTPRMAFVAARELADTDGPVAVDRLRALASPDQPTHRYQSALIALAGHAEVQDRGLFVKAVCGRSAALRAAAIGGLFRSNSPDRASVEQVLLRDESLSVRIEAARRSRDLVADWAVDVILQALSDSADDVRLPAVRSLTTFSDERVFARLSAVAKNDQEMAHIRGCAAEGLALIDEERAIQFLKRESAVFDLHTRIYTDPILRGESR